MKTQDRIKRILHLENPDGSKMNIASVPLRIELRRGIDVVKIFTNGLWNSTQGEPDGAHELKVLTGNEQFLLLVDGDELDTYKAGQYTVHAFYFEADTDFDDSESRRYAPFEGNISINE